MDGTAEFCSIVNYANHFKGDGWMDEWMNGCFKTKNGKKMKKTLGKLAKLPSERVIKISLQKQLAGRQAGRQAGSHAGNSQLAVNSKQETVAATPTITTTSRSSFIIIIIILNEGLSLEQFWNIKKSFVLYFFFLLEISIIWHCGNM